jgi:HEAT repeat protein
MASIRPRTILALLVVFTVVGGCAGLIGLTLIVRLSERMGLVQQPPPKTLDQIVRDLRDWPDPTGAVGELKRHPADRTRRDVAEALAASLQGNHGFAKQEVTVLGELGRWGGDEDLPEIDACLRFHEGPVTLAPDDAVRRAAIEAYAGIGTPAACERIVLRLENPADAPQAKAAIRRLGTAGREALQAIANEENASASLRQQARALLNEAQ